MIERLTAQVQQESTLSQLHGDLSQFSGMLMINEVHGRTRVTDGQRLSQFSGMLKLAEDPPAWQQRARGDWE